MTRKQKFQLATVVFLVIGGLLTLQDSIDAAIAGLVCFVVAAGLLLLSLKGG